MISQECRYDCSSQPFYCVLLRFWRFIKKIFQRYEKWVQMKHQHRQLLEMDDHLLKDIGLSRCDAVRITQGHALWRFLFQKNDK